jgi:hypothetical protein
LGIKHDASNFGIAIGATIASYVLELEYVSGDFGESSGK